MNILTIGNSFSQDAHRYLYDIARAQRVKVKTMNLFFPACSLETHYRNMLSERVEYDCEINGMATGFKISIKEALAREHWDVVTTQQVSQLAPYYESYQPYLNELVAYIRKYQPKAKIYIQETWAYEEGSKRLINELKYEKRADMYNDVHAANIKALADSGIDGIIPSGKAMELATEYGIAKIHRDTFHAHYGYGRYMIGLVWFGFLTGLDFTENDFRYLDIPATEEEIEIVKKAAKDALKSVGK